MKMKQLTRGIEILRKYQKDFDEDYMRAEHDEIWIPGPDPDLPGFTEADAKELEELGWRPDEDAWYHTV